MVYTMKIFVDGACRGNGQPGSIGAAAACFQDRRGNYDTFTEILNTHEYEATNQRAEILAIILALEVALDKYRNMDANPYLDVEIFTDSRYAVGCMTEWAHTWTRNGWRNAAGDPVANQDLIHEALALDSKLKEDGTVQYSWISRSSNQVADRACNDALDSL